MKKQLPFITLSVGLLMSIILFVFSPLNPAGTMAMPLLAALFMCEIGLILTLVGAWLSGRVLMNKVAVMQNAALCVGNILLALNLLSISINIWPNNL